MVDLETEFGRFKNFEYRARKPTNSIVSNYGINDSCFQVKPLIGNSRITHPAYRVWKHMLDRCFNCRVKDRQPTYRDITCCTEWLLFSTFALWFKNEYIEGYQLDKDLLVKDNKIYSPETCIFIPQYINKFVLTSDNSRGTLPLGVSYIDTTNKYKATISSNNSNVHLGYYDNPMDAHRAWQLAKLKIAKEFNFQPLNRIIEQLTSDISNGIETLKL